MAVRLEEVDTRDVPESTLEAMHEFYLDVDDEELPGDPPKPVRQRMVDWRNYSAFQLVRHWVAWDGDRLVAASGAEMNLEQNLDNAFGWVHVRKDARGRGLGKMVARPMLDLVQEQDRRRLAVAIPEGSEYSAIAERGGMKDAFLAQRNRLLLADVDWDLVSDWVTRASERADDYELVFRAGPLPEEDLEPYCQLHDIMNTAPMEDYERDPEVVTPEMWRAWEEHDLKRETVFLIYVARHKPTGSLVGLTEFIYQQLNPAQAWQGDTAVHPDHRQKGLGRWLKAAMLQKVRDQYPLVERIDTENAGSNEPMLNINLALGFRPILRNHVWQGDVATLRERLKV